MPSLDISFSSLSWYSLASIAFISFGYQNYLYKLSAVKNLDSRAVTGIYVISTTLFLWCAVYWETPNPWAEIRQNRLLLALSALDAIFYYITTITRMEALRFLPSSIVFPMVRMSTLVVVIFGIVILGEDLSEQLLFSLAILAVVVVLISSERHKDRSAWPSYPIGVVLSLLAMLSSSATNIISKLASEMASVSMYMALANTGIIFLYGLEMLTRKAKAKTWSFAAARIALPLGISNVIGWYAYLFALRQGPLSVVSTIVALAFVAPIVLSALFHQERLSARRGLAVLLTGLALIVLKG